MESANLTDEACERVLSGCLNEGDAGLWPVRWFVEDLRSVYCEPVSRAARAMHPSATGRSTGIAFVWPSQARFCSPDERWQQRVLRRRGRQD